MTLHLLIVEDDEEFVEELEETVSGLPGGKEVLVARSRDQAYEMLASGFFDLVVLDLTIPTVVGALDADAQHGHAVFHTIRAKAAGTPIFVLTGSSAEDFLEGLVSLHRGQVDIWGEGEKAGTVLFLRKSDIERCPEMLRRVALAVEGLSSVELEGDGLSFGVAEDRLIRMFAKRVKGVRCAASELRSGLSGARVIRLRVTDERGVVLHDAVAKLSTHAEVRAEGERYDEYVTRLAAAATPRKLMTLRYGACRLAGIFFGLAGESAKSVFEIASKEPERAEAVVGSVEAAMEKWMSGVPETRTAIKDIRRRLLDDEGLAQIRERFDLEWAEDFEEREIQARLGCSHGDLHGSNILVSDGGAELVDYGDVGEGPGSLDPVTLELSLLFHPDKPENDAWPSAEQARFWGDLETYVEGCPFAEFVRRCRGWAIRAAAGNREVAASAYSYLARQLKYDDTDKSLAAALLEGVRRFYDEST